MARSSRRTRKLDHRGGWSWTDLQTLLPGIAWRTSWPGSICPWNARRICPVVSQAHSCSSANRFKCGGFESLGAPGLPMPTAGPCRILWRVMIPTSSLHVMPPQGTGADRNDGGPDWGTGSASQIAALPFLYYNASAPVECLWPAAWHAVPGATSHHLLRVGLGAICRLGNDISRDPDGSQAHVIAVGERRDPEMRVK